MRPNPALQIQGVTKNASPQHTRRPVEPPRRKAELGRQILIPVLVAPQTRRGWPRVVRWGARCRSPRPGSRTPPCRRWTRAPSSRRPAGRAHGRGAQETLNQALAGQSVRGSALTDQAHVLNDYEDTTAKTEVTAGP
jgi:hypothetical protein